MGLLDGKVALVTGAGGGLGRGHARLLAQEGAAVVVNDLGGARDGSGSGSSSMADRVVKEIRDAGGKAVADYGSVTNREDALRMVQTAVDNFGKLDICINNAGILRDKSFVKLAPEDMKAVLAVHLEGAFFVSQPAFRFMKERGGYGRFVFTASAAGIFGNFGQSNYGAAKMGLVGLSNVLAQEGAKYNILSNVIAPIAQTRLLGDLLGPLADKLNPSQVSGLVAYLCSDDSAVTHEIFSVGGGRVARIFVGLTPGWFGGQGSVPTPEEIRDHLDEIRDTNGFIIPGNAAEELAAAVPLLTS